jgi:hypothetical protein
MRNIREVVIRILSRSIKTGEPVALSSYIPPRPANAREALADATIKDTLKALQENRIPAFSGDSGDTGSEKFPTE